MIVNSNTGWKHFNSRQGLIDQENAGRTTDTQGRRNGLSQQVSLTGEEAWMRTFQSDFRKKIQDIIKGMKSQ
jgi:hypothetical protein